MHRGVCICVEACLSVWVYVCSSEYAEECEQVFVGGEVCVDKICVCSMCARMCAHTCRCIRKCTCIFLYAGMCVCAQACACMVDYCVSPVSL